MGACFASSADKNNEALFDDKETEKLQQDAQQLLADSAETAEYCNQRLLENGIDCKQIAMEAGVAVADATILMCSKMFDDAKDILGDTVTEYAKNPEYQGFVDKVKDEAMKQGQGALSEMMMKEGLKQIDAATRAAIVETDLNKSKAHFDKIDIDPKALVQKAVMQAILAGKKKAADESK